MGFWSELFGSKRRSKKTSKKKSSKKKSKRTALKEYVIFDKYSDKEVMRVKAKSESAASRMIKSDDHRIILAHRWDSESKL